MSNMEKEDKKNGDLKDESQKQEIKVKEFLNLVEKLQEEKTSLEEEKMILLADIDNLSKQHRREINDVERYGLIKFLKELIPLVDMFNSIMENKNVSEEVKNWLKGFEMLHQQLESLLQSNKVKKIQVGKNSDFNGNYHLAISDEYSEGIAKGKISKVIKNGYLLGDRLIEPAIVIISKGQKIEENINNKKENLFREA